MGFVRAGKLTMGGLLVAGRDEVIADHAPNHEWKYSRTIALADGKPVTIGLNAYIKP